MATFYSQADQDIYASGNKFIPQEQYRLGPYTPPAIMGQNTNAGIAGTQAAYPYKWPYPEGGGEGAGNISGTQQRSWSPNQNLGPTNITDYEAEADDVGSTWGGSLARLQDLYSKLPTPTNLLRRGWTGIQRWREKREIANEQKLQNEIAAHNQAAADAARGSQVQQNIQTYGSGDRPDVGINAPGAGPGQSPTGGNVEGTPFAQGGRIGYADRGFVEDVNVEGPGFDENVMMASDESNDRILESLYEEHYDRLKGLGHDDESIHEIIMGMFEEMSTQAPDSEDQGLASLV